MRFRAQILQAAAGPARAPLAWELIALQNADCALNRRAPHGPFDGWEAIEHAEILYVAAYVANRLGAVQQEPRLLASANATYAEVLEKLPKRSFLVSYPKRRLGDQARAGLVRVRRAMAGQYDEQWLMV